MKTLQKVSSVHAEVHNHFNQERHLVSPGLQTKTSRRVGRVARPRGLMTAWVAPIDTLHKGRFLIDRDRSRQSDQLSRNSVSSWDVVRGWGLGPFEGPQP